MAAALAAALSDGIGIPENGSIEQRLFFNFFSFFEDFSNFRRAFGALHFEKSSKMIKN